MVAPLRRDLVLLGGGHTHMLALRSLSMRPPPGSRLTLVSDTDYAPYSGMLPGLVAGHYRFEEAHIDLRRFCQTRSIRFIKARVTGINPDLGRVQLHNRPALEYDFLSINVGAQPELDTTPGAREYAIPVKPVGSFYARWNRLLERLHQTEDRLRVLVIGGGAGSVEIALAVDFRLQGRAQLSLICGSQLLPDYNPRVRNAARTALASRGISVHEQSRVREVQAGTVEIGVDTTMEYDELLWCTGVTPSPWIADTGMAVNDAGFLLVDDSLQVVGQPGHFAAGDVAVQQQNPRPRAGVFAVRQAPVLAENLAAVITGQKPREHKPQQMFLSLLSLGAKQAIAERGPFAARGRWVWRWKDRIDRAFMAQFDEAAPAMEIQPTAAELCGGCGAKLPADMLRRALTVVASEYPETLALDQFQDDATLLTWDASSPLVQSVDTLRALIDDVFEMGRIATIHALSDLYAMAAVPHSAQLHICLPPLAATLQQRDLEQLLLGVARELEAADCKLIGGHSMEGSELSIGLTVNGAWRGGKLLRKKGGIAGDVIVMTKPLGVGVAFAAAMHGAVTGQTLAAAVGSMLLSNADAAEIALKHGVTACTDLTGFGLLGHLLEMLPSDLAAQIAPDTLPLLPGTPGLWDAGYRSTLHPGNAALVPANQDWPPSCFDPQTSGGLLLFAAAERAPALLNALQSAGYEHATVIGELQQRRSGGPLHRLATAHASASP